MKIGVIGAGLVGRLLAFMLLKKKPGAQISLFEKDTLTTKTCSFISGGMIAPFCELANSEKIIFDLGLESLQLWDQIIKSIQHPIFFKRNGTLVVSHKQDENELKRFKENIDSKLEANPDNYQLLSNQKDVSALESSLENKFHTGLFFPNEGHIDNRDILQGIISELQTKENIKVFENSETEIFDQNTLINLQTNEKHHFDIIFDCRGLGDNKFKNLRGVRGEVIKFYSENMTLNRPVRLIHPRFPLYIIPRANNVFLIGATSIESEDRSDITIRSALELLSAVFSLNSKFGEAKILEMNSQLRPTLPDHKPKILFSSNKSTISINGLYRHGFMISPKIIELVLNFVFENKIENSYQELFAEINDKQLSRKSLMSFNTSY